MKKRERRELAKKCLAEIEALGLECEVSGHFLKVGDIQDAPRDLYKNIRACAKEIIEIININKNQNPQ